MLKKPMQQNAVPHSSRLHRDEWASTKLDPTAAQKAVIA